MPDRDSDQRTDAPDPIVGAAIRDLESWPISIDGNRYCILPEVIGAGDLDELNSALAVMFAELREAAALPHKDERVATIRALGAAMMFIARLQSSLFEHLISPLLHLANALQALGENKVETLLKPASTPIGGRAPDSLMRQALIGFAVGAVGQLQWTGLRRTAAHKVIADTLNKIGVKPSRGSGRLTARTVREWYDRVGADVGGRSVAAIRANALLTPTRRSSIDARTPEDARKFILGVLTYYARGLHVATALAGKKAR